MTEVLTQSKTPSPLRRQLDWWAAQAKAPRLRPIGQFAEAEIVLPDGPFRGRRYSMHRQHWARLWFECVGTGERWQRFVLTGPSQSGKSLHGHVIPAMYHLFEHGETVGLGLPDLAMANDKWTQDFLPAIEASRFREWLPTRGPGSRQGRVHDSVQFQNGATLRVFTGGGGDKSRAGFTCRVMVITEVDGMDVVGGQSKEADKISQLEARTVAYGSRRRLYLECTVSTDTGRITLERKGGTDSRIVCPCPHCGELVTPEREHLVGWQDATTANEAKLATHFACPECSHAITDAERAAMNAGCQLVHRGQTIEVGWVLGDPIPTDTFSLRYSAFNNLFMPAGEIGKKEWDRVHGPADKEDERERELRQFFWAVPVESAKLPVLDLDADAICRRVTNDPRGRVPAGTDCLAVGVDVGKWKIHWCLTAFRRGATPHVVDYGVLDVPSREMGEERAILATLRELRDNFCVPGWPTESGETRKPDRLIVDARYQGERGDLYPVYAFASEPESEGWVYPSIGWGVGTYGASGEYKAPATLSRTVLQIGEHYHLIATVKASQWRRVVYVDVDHWKGWAHKRISTPAGQPGALTLFAGGPRDHLLFARHVTAERQEEEFVAGKGQQVRWVRLRSANHLLDALTYSCVGGHMAGARIESGDRTQADPPAAKPSEPDRERRPWITPGGGQRRRGGRWLG